MQWHDEAIILGVKRHGETSAIVEVMTHERGRYLGLVRAGRSRTMQPTLQPGNQVELTWRARLDEHLGEFKIEPVTLRAARLMETAVAVHGVQALGSLLRLLPERDPHPHLFKGLEIILDALDDPAEAGELFVRFELALLNDLGFGLDLSQCAATGTRDSLAYVSPKSGKAVSQEAGAPWADKMLALPGFLTRLQSATSTRSDLEKGFRLTGYFLDRHVYEPRGIETSLSRHSFIQAVLKAFQT